MWKLFRARSLTTTASDKKLGWALQQTSQSKVLSQVRGAVESASGQFSNIGTRLEMVRLGVSGLSLASLNFDIEGKPLIADKSLVRGEKGGAASADDFDTGDLGVFINGNLGFGDRDKSDRQEGFDFDTKGVTVGVDYRFSDDFVLGLATGYNNSEVGIDASGGDLDTESYSVSTFGTYYSDDFYLDTILSYAWNDYSSIRNIVYPTVNTLARGDTDGEQYSVGVGAGYELNLGAVTLGPHGRAEYVRAVIDGYKESGSAGGHDLTLRDQEVKSLTTTLRGYVGYAVSTPIGVFQPQLTMEWQHEFENRSRGVSAKYTYDPFNTWFALPTDNPDRDYFTVSAAVSGTFKRGVSAFLNYETIVGLSKVSTHMVSTGIRMEF